MEENKNEEKLITTNNKQEKGYIELKEVDNYEETDETKEKEKIEIPNETNTEEKEEEKAKLKSENDDKISAINDDDSDSSSPVGKKIMKIILLNLNYYWISIIATISLVVTMYVYEALGIYIIQRLDITLKEKTLDAISEIIDTIFNKLGVKWLLIINISDHLSIGFFTLTTFSWVIQETKNIKKFYIVTIIEVILYYAFSIFLLAYLINDLLKNFVKDVIENPELTLPDDLKEKLIELANKLIEYVVILVADYLSTYNMFLEVLVLGSLYIFIFVTPKKCAENKVLLYLFRFLSVIPIGFIVFSLWFRALQKTTDLKINEYTSAILLGQKITTFSFFIVGIFVIKYKSIKYENVFDEEGLIDTRVFTKIGSVIFAVFGAIEFIAGCFLPSWVSYGIGRKYLIILCAPIFTLYDYKKQYKVTFPCCHKGDMSLCFKIIIYIIGYLVMIILAIIFCVVAYNFIKDYIVPILEFIIENYDEISKLLSNLSKLFNV